MRIEEAELLEKYLPFDRPVPYKDLLISPIKLRDMYEVQEILGVLQIDKNDLGEIAFISMSKLRFILLAICTEEKYREALCQLLYKALSIKNKEIDIYIDDTTEYLIIGKKIGAIKGNEPDYDRICKFILNDIKNNNIKNITFDRFDEYER